MVKLKNPEQDNFSQKKTKRGRTKKFKSVGLFEHVDQIRKFRDPNYFNNLSELDRKSFNHFMILRALSMNPQMLDRVVTLYRFFDIIPSSQFYTLLISYIPQDPTYYRWIRPQKSYKVELVDIVSKRFEVSNQHAEEYIDLLSLTEEGKKSLVSICQGFGKTEDEINQLLSNNDDDTEQ